jgi:hypothetical protein
MTGNNSFSNNLLVGPYFLSFKREKERENSQQEIIK